MATLAFGAIAKAIGANWVWAGVLAMAGNVIDQRLFGTKQHFEGQRMDSLQVQSSSYGGTIPIVMGNAVRTSGNIIFATDFVEHEKTESSGGKGGGGGSTTTTYSYSISFAVALCQGPIKGLRNRAWFDGSAVNLSRFNYRLYTGTETQMPNPYIEAKNGGAGTTPAYRGLAYIVFQDMDLTDYGNRIPQMQFEIIKAESQTLEAGIRELCAYAKIPEENQYYSGLDYNVNGVLISSQGTFRETIEPLQSAYFFDVTESGDKLKFQATANQETITLFEDDLGTTRYGEEPIDKLTVVDEDILELPSQITVSYYDITNNYQTGTKKSRRLYYAETGNERKVDLPVVLNPETAQLIAEQQLLLIWLSRTTYTGQLGNKWAVIEPADVIETTVNGVNRTFQITKTDYDGGLVKFEAKGFRAPKVIGYIPYTPPELPDIERGIITLYLLDIPLLTDNEGAGFYIVATSDKGFATVNLYRSESSDNSSFVFLDSIGYESTAGTAKTVLGQGQAFFFDYKNTVDVELMQGTLKSISEADVINRGNAALLGEEIIQFTTAELVAENTYRLSGLLRGRRGTEWAMNTHQEGERFILLDISTIVPKLIATDNIGRKITYLYRYFDSQDEFNTIDFTHNGNGYKPYSVCYVRGKRNANGDLTITWLRRTRIGGSWRNNVDALLSETSESYTVEIMQNNIVKRTATTNTSELVYTAAQQIADFGSIQSAVTVRIYQMSDKVGRGYMKEETI